MPAHIRATFMPDPPLKHLPPPLRNRSKAYTDDGSLVTGDVIKSDIMNSTVKSEDNKENTNANKNTKKAVGMSGLASYIAQFEKSNPPSRTINPTPQSLKQIRQIQKRASMDAKNKPFLETYRKEQRESGGEYNGMNCYNTLFVGRLAYEVTERKILREFESFGTVKDVKLVTVKDDDDNHEIDTNNPTTGTGGKSCGYAFVEFEQEEDMKRAYRAADGMRMEGKEIVVDVERGHTVPNWLPRRLGGGLGGTRYVLCASAVYCLLSIVYCVQILNCCVFMSYIFA